MGKQNKKNAASTPVADHIKIEKRRRLFENTATFGLLLVAVALVVPFANFGSTDFLRPFKWVFGSGAIIYLISRIVNVSDPDESLRIRRLRRIQFWAGVALGVATFFWFYNEDKLGPYAGPGAILRDTVLFSLVAALLQLISSWMITWRQRKEQQPDHNKK